MSGLYSFERISLRISILVPAIIKRLKLKETGARHDHPPGKTPQLLQHFVYRTSPSGKVYLSRCPDMSRFKWSKAQKAHRQRFKEAHAYAQAAMALFDYFKGKDLLAKK